MPGAFRLYTCASSSGEEEGPMARKKMIIDKKFQVRTIAGVAVIAVIFFSAVVAVIGFYSFRNRTNMASEITMLEGAVQTQDNIVNAFIEYAKTGRSGRVKLSVDTVAEDHKRSMETIGAHISRLQGYADDLFYLTAITIGIALLAIIVYGIYMMRLTHRISGPIYVMSRYIQEMIDGREPRFRNLRDKDEFKEMYARLVELGEKMKGG